MNISSQFFFVLFVSLDVRMEFNGPSCRCSWRNTHVAQVASLRDKLRCTSNEFQIATSEVDRLGGEIEFLHAMDQVWPTIDLPRWTSKAILDPFDMANSIFLRQSVLQVFRSLESPMWTISVISLSYSILPSSN